MKLLETSRINSLSFSLCVVVQILDEMLLPMKIDWQPPNHGFSYKIYEEEESGSRDKKLENIYVKLEFPNWPPTSYIVIRLQRLWRDLTELGFNSGWDAWHIIEGCIYAPHLEKFDQKPIGFKYEVGFPGYIVPENSGSPGDEILKNALRRRKDIMERTYIGL